MIRSLLLGCSAFLITVIAVYALSEHGGRADFVYVNRSGIHTLDPARMSWTRDFRVALNLWEGLADTHPQTTEPSEGAALFPPDISRGGLKYTFTVRDDARWSNGDPVTASDFVRGWRRGMEPGTATDYSFLFTDHIAGAAEYVQRRVRAANALTALSRLRDSWGIDSEQGRSFARHPIFNDIWAKAGFDATRLPSDDADKTWQAVADRLNDCEVDWDDLYDRVFDEHVARFDERFDAVGVKALDDHTLQVELTRPCPYFLDLAAFPTFLPCHQSIELLREGSGAPITAQGLVVYDPQWTKPDYHRNGYPGIVTNGPYRLSEWTFKRRVRLTVNPYYRAAGDIACRTIDMLVYDHLSAALMAYEAGDVDFLPSMDVPYDHEIARLSRSGERPDFHLCDVLATYFLNFNCVSERVLGRVNPFTDARMRRALSLAVDKKRIVTNVLGRGDRIAHTFVPEGAIPGYSPPAWSPVDADEARRLLADAGYPGGVGMPRIDLLYLPSDERVCQAIAHMWEQELGVGVELRCKESKTFAEDKANHRYMVARGNWYGDYYDPTTFLDCLVTGNGNNDSGYSSSRYDALIARARETNEAPLRAALLRQAESIIVQEDYPILPILHYALPIAIKPYVRGLYPNARLRFPFKYVTINR
ncbi:MAG: peptide ABC transporter substrate-binding protein [Planctomycetota bacterium]|jgi:oligopeptide transport system substrate-binding protein